MYVYMDALKITNLYLYYLYVYMDALKITNPYLYFLYVYINALKITTLYLCCFYDIMSTLYINIFNGFNKICFIGLPIYNMFVVIIINLVYSYNWNNVFHKKNKTKTYYKNYDKLSFSKQMLLSPTFLRVNQSDNTFVVKSWNTINR